MQIVKRKSVVEKLDLKEYAEEAIKEKVFERLKEKGINKNTVENISINYFNMQVSLNNYNHLVLRFFPSSVSVYFKNRSITDFMTFSGKELGIDVLLVLDSVETEQIINFVKEKVRKREQA